MEQVPTYLEQLSDQKAELNNGTQIRIRITKTENDPSYIIKNGANRVVTDRKSNKTPALIN